MKKEKFLEIKENLKIKDGEWTVLNDIDAIILDDGVGIYPNWNHLRFLFDGDTIFIKHGLSEPYGARLTNTFNLSSNMLTISMPPGDVVIPTSFYNSFRLPKEGDILRSTVGTQKVLSESLVKDCKVFNNSTVIHLVNPVKMTQESHLSFYDPGKFNKENCIHSSIVEGIYMKFKENENGRKSKFGAFHETIKGKSIQEIHLKLSTKQKTYTLK